MRTAPLIEPTTETPEAGGGGGWRTRRRIPVREQGLVRITVDIPEVQHKRLKVAAVEAGVTIRQLILDLLEREGIKNL